MALCVRSSFANIDPLFKSFSDLTEVPAPGKVLLGLGIFALKQQGQPAIHGMHIQVRIDFKRAIKIEIVRKSVGSSAPCRVPEKLPHLGL